jgi:hypothetical protein
MLKPVRMKRDWYLLALMVIFSVLGATHIQAAPAQEKTMNLAFELLPKARLPKAEEIARSFGHFATTKEQSLVPKRSQTTGKNDAEILEFELKPGGRLSSR